MGEPKEIPGAKFGRLNKSLIDFFSQIEEDMAKQMLRMAHTKNEIQ